MQIIGFIKPIPPYNFTQLRQVLAKYSEPVINQVDDEAFWRTLRIENQLALVRVTSVGTPTSPQLQVELVNHIAINTDKLLAKVAHLLGTNIDLSAFYSFAQSDPTLWQVIQPVHGLPLPRTATLFEALVALIIEQQISWVSALKAQQIMHRWAGNFVNYNGVSHYDAPTPSQLAKATVDDLKPMKITFRRINLIIQIAREIMAGNIALEALQILPFDIAFQHLCSINGIGTWTATHTLERGRGDYQFVGLNDVALQAAVNRYFHQTEGKLTEMELETTLQPYREYAGLVAHFTLMRWVLDQY